MPSTTRCCHRCGRCKTATTHSLPLPAPSDALRLPPVPPRHRGVIWNVSHPPSSSATPHSPVLKWVRPDHICDRPDHLAHMLRIHAVATRLVDSFHDHINTRGYTVSFVTPLVWSPHLVVEPYIPDFLKFNSNSGWAHNSRRSYNKVVQALSHYSYVRSAGEFVLCDLQGGVSDDKTITLANPVLTSRKAQTYGCTDMGPDYIALFFKGHVCSDLCDHLPVPDDNKVFFHPVRERHPAPWC